MKLFWFSLIFYVFYQMQPAVTASSSFDYLTDAQEKLIDELGMQIRSVLKTKSTAVFSLEDDDDPRLVQNFSKMYEDESLNGNVLLYNTIIDGLTEIDEDVTTVFQDEQQLRVTVNLEQLMVYGKFIFATPSDVAYETGTFSVTWSKVRIEGIVSVMANPNGYMTVTKVVPKIWSEELNTSVKPRTAATLAILKSAMSHLENNVKKQLAKTAIIEASTYYPRKSSYDPSSMLNWTIFEAQRFINQHYNPYTVNKTISNSWYFGPMNFYGLSNFHLNDVVPAVKNNLVYVYVQIFTSTVKVNFPFSLDQKRYKGECSIEKMDFIGKIKLATDDSKRIPIMDVLAMEMTGCECHVRNLATGMRAYTNADDLGMDADEFLCLIIRSEISTSKIAETIQKEIFDKVDLGPHMEAISQVLFEDQLFEASYSITTERGRNGFNGGYFSRY